MVSLPDGAELLGTFTKATCPVPGNNRHDDRLTRRDVPTTDSCTAAKRGYSITSEASVRG
jgi:hypothetical protein